MPGHCPHFIPFVTLNITIISSFVNSPRPGPSLRVHGRQLIPDKENPPQEILDWVSKTKGIFIKSSEPGINQKLNSLASLQHNRGSSTLVLFRQVSQFTRWSHAERLLALDQLIDNCEPQQVRHMMQVQVGVKLELSWPSYVVFESFCVVV